MKAFLARLLDGGPGLAFSEINHVVALLRQLLRHVPIGSSVLPSQHISENVAVAVSSHYFRDGRHMSLRLELYPPVSPGKVPRLAAAAILAAAMLAPVAAWSQYPGQVTKKSKDAPQLRSIAVLEWTGEPGKPKACRIVPVMVFDGEKLQDGGIYLARPEPLALSGEVEYELKQNGTTFGLFDIKNAGQEQGSWVGYGDWNAMPKPKPVVAVDPGKVDDVEDDKPVLHRKKHPGEAPTGGTTSDKGSSSSTAPSDPDRPTLHKKDSSDSSTSSGASPASDPDRPTLHKKTDDTSAPAGSSTPAGNNTPTTAGAPTSDPDRPTIKKGKQKPPEDIGHVDSLPDITDPDRPRLKRGKSSGNGLVVLPTLMGLPPDMQQAVAVSDATSRPDHPWTYSWANPDDEAKMKSAVEDLARTALGASVPAPAPKTPPPRTAAVTPRKTAKPAPPPAPAPLEDEEYRVFELAYGSGATLVLTAHTDDPLASQKFVTIVAQPDLYGNVRVLLKSVTDMAHLDETPRMRLVDAVDALADNRGELLFELRGDTSRQFALYRVYRGAAEKLFVSGGGVYGTVSSE
jgi:hypothetical protein